jgi:hypothetical protein
MGAQFSKPQYSFTVKLGYDYNAGGNIGTPLSQFGIKLSCFDFLMGSPLPINLYEFVAKRSGNAAELEWATTYEQSNQGFRIQRKTGSDDFTDVGFLSSQSPDGNSQLKLFYNYTEPNTIKGISQYRVIQTDVQGQTRVSEIRSVAGLEENISLLIYPNPSVDGKVNIVFDESKEGRDIMINDFMGHTVKHWKQVMANSITAENLLPGIYIVRIADCKTGYIKINKFIIAQ